MLKRILVAFVSVFAINSPLAFALDNTLVIVNTNSIDSPQIGAYYASKRGIPASNIVQVRARASFFTDWSDFVSLRDQIIKAMQQRMQRLTGIVPASCSPPHTTYYCPESIDQLRNNTDIKYLVTTRGIPTRMTIPGSPFGSAPTSVDNYLRHWVVNYFAEDVNFDSSPRARDFGDGRGMRVVDPATDYELIIGRIDGIDLQSSLNLIDRAVDAEQNGIYGKLVGSNWDDSGDGAWRDATDNSPIYGTSSNDWMYQLGIFGNFTSTASSGIRYTSDASCLTHLEVDNRSAPEGVSPQHCVARMMRGKEPPPGRSNSRVPDPDSALIYQGALHGQPTNGTFTGFLNWRKKPVCDDAALCRDTQNPEACAAASTDVFREINTECVGVAEGFIGYNHQSYPVSFMTVFPTAWTSGGATNPGSWHNNGSGDAYQIGLPDISQTDSSDGDSASVWFRNTDQVADPQCYSDYSMATTYACAEERRIFISNKSTGAVHTYDSTNPQTYRISLEYKARDINAPLRLKARVLIHEPGSNNFQVLYGNFNFSEPSQSGTYTVPTGDTPDWTPLQLTFTVDPDKHTQARSNCLADQKCTNRIGTSYLDTPWDGRYDGIKVVIESSEPFSGELGIDAVTVTAVNNDDPLALANGSFDEGHESVTTGDHAANFLSRLNGTAFWGSVSHHQSGGHSFSRHPVTSLVYFLRGLPLGDAVWFNENFNSGLLYGDPHYSPVAVKLDYIDQDRVFDNMTVVADTVNGNNPDLVSTTYAVDYCPGADFHTCDFDNSWIATGLSGNGGSRDMLLGNLDLSAVPFGDYTLRLAVNSSNAALASSQTFYDYYPVINRYKDDEIPTYQIAGRITNDDGQPIPGVSIDINNNSGLTSTVTTDHNGHYSKTGLLDDTYIVTPYKNGYQFTATTGNVFEIINGQSVLDKDFTATTADYTVSGTILNTKGMPVPDVTLMVVNNSGLSLNTTTNAQGYFEQPGLANDTYIVMPEASTEYTFAINSGNVFTIVNGADVTGKDFTASAAAGNTISGTIVDNNNKPMVAAKVTLTNGNGSIQKSTSTNAQGYYELTNVPNDLYIILASANGYQFSYLPGTVFVLINDNDLENSDWTANPLNNRYFIAGYILENGAPLAGADVYVANNSGYSTTITTDNSGFYKAEDLSRNTYVVSPSKAGYRFQPTKGNVFQTVIDAAVIDKNFIATSTP